MQGNQPSNTVVVLKPMCWAVKARSQSGLGAAGAEPSAAGGQAVRKPGTRPWSLRPLCPIAHPLHNSAAAASVRLIVSSLLSAVPSTRNLPHLAGPLGHSQLAHLQVRMFLAPFIRTKNLFVILLLHTQLAAAAEQQSAVLARLAQTEAERDRLCRLLAGTARAMHAAEVAAAGLQVSVSSLLA